MADTVNMYYEAPTYLTKLMTFLFIGAFLMIIIEPEKIEMFTYVTTTCLSGLGVVFLIKNIWTVAHGRGPMFHDIKKFDLAHVGEYTGNVAYAFELSSVFLSLRLTAAKNVQYSTLSSGMLIFIGIMYYVSAASYLFVFHSHELFNTNAFSLYKHENYFFRNLFYFYMPNNIYTYVMNAIFATEIVETLPAVTASLLDKDGQICRKRLVALRIIVWFVMVFSSLFAHNVVRILNISGSIFTPICSYFGPLIIFYTFCSAFHHDVSTQRKLHDTVFFIFGAVVAFWGVVNAFG